MTGIDRAIDRAGGQIALARLLGCTQQFISKMKRRGYAPVGTARRLSELYRIPLSELIKPLEDT